jgi:WD40 repeat protein
LLALAFHGEDLLVLDEDGGLHRLNVTTGTSERELVLPVRFLGMPGTDISFAPTQDILATYVNIGSHRLLDVYDEHTGEIVKALELEEGHVVAISDDLEVLVTKQSQEDSVSVMSFTSDGLSEITTLETAQITTSGDLDATGAHYIYGDENGQLILVDLATSERTLVGVYDNPIRYVGLSPNGQIAVAMDEDGYFRIWEIPAP